MQIFLYWLSAKNNWLSAKNRLQTCNFIKKETLAQVFSCEFCEIPKNTFFHRTPLVAASEVTVLVSPNYLPELSELIIGISNRPLAEDNVSYSCVSDKHVKKVTHSFTFRIILHYMY